MSAAGTARSPTKSGFLAGRSGGVGGLLTATLCVSAVILIASSADSSSQAVDGDGTWCVGIATDGLLLLGAGVA